MERLRGWRARPQQIATQDTYRADTQKARTCGFCLHVEVYSHAMPHSELNLVIKDATACKRTTTLNAKD